MGIQENRLYYQNSYLQTFQAVVSSCIESEQGYFVTLEQTAFYPTSGGQPNDTGWLGEARVLDVWVDGEDIIHLVNQPLAVGTVVEGRIDWNRRFDHMQHHCGQHILSACFEEDMNVDTVGFHLGNEMVTIDLAVSNLDFERARQVEWHANEIIWSNLEISARFIDEAELSSLPLRHPPKVERDIRIVSIGHFDHNACGGTHPRRTGEVGQLKINRIEKSRQGVRLTFLCGQRALADYNRKLEVLQQLVGITSCGMDELVENIEKLQSRAVNLQKSEDLLKRELSGYLADGYVQHAVTTSSGVKILVQSVSQAIDVQGLKTIANSIVSKWSDTPFVAVLLAQIGDRIQLIANSSGVVDVNQWIRPFLAERGGKGGGTSMSVQGSAPLQAGVHFEAWEQELIDALKQRV